MTGFYHLSVSIIGRGKGRSAVACAAYRSGTSIADQRYGETHDYTRKRGIISEGIIAPESAPRWAGKRDKLWNELERFEKRKDAQLAREFTLGLPHELSGHQRAELVQEFIQQELTPRGLVADWAVHAPNTKGDDRNYHAHIMASMRSMSSDGFEDRKDRSLNTPTQLEQWRKAWAEILNRAFERYGIKDANGQTVRVDHRSHDERGIERLPTKHLGVHATAMERKGISTELGNRNRKARAGQHTIGTADLQNAKTEALLFQRLESRIEEFRHEGGEDNEPSL